MYVNVPVVLGNLAKLERKYNPVPIPLSAPAAGEDAGGDRPADGGFVLGRTFMSGCVHAGVRPIRWASVFNFEKKWICPAWMYGKDVFPNYISGAGWVLHKDFPNNRPISRQLSKKHFLSQKFALIGTQLF